MEKQNRQTAELAGNPTEIIGTRQYAYALRMVSIAQYTPEYVAARRTYTLSVAAALDKNGLGMEHMREFLNSGLHEAAADMRNPDVSSQVWQLELSPQQWDDYIDRHICPNVQESRGQPVRGRYEDLLDALDKGTATHTNMEKKYRGEATD